MRFLAILALLLAVTYADELFLTELAGETKTVKTDDKTKADPAKTTDADKLSVKDKTKEALAKAKKYA